MYISRGHKLFTKKNVFLSLNIVFALANSVVPDEIMQHFT